MFVLNVFLRSLYGEIMHERIVQLQKYIEDHRLNGIFLTDPSSVFYFSGFTGTSGDATIFVTKQQSYILTDHRYTLQVSKQCPGFHKIGKSAEDLSVIYEMTASVWDCRLGFENHSVSFALWNKMKKTLPHVFWLELNDFPQLCRSIKQPDELNRIRRACEISVKALRSTLPFIRAGVSENDIAAELEYRIRKLGASGVSFETIVASGERSAMPHGTASDRILQSGDTVTIDFGAMYQGYASDMTRTFFIGTPDDALIRIYQAVLHAQQAAIEQFKPGMLCCQLDAVARNYLQESGYGSNFTHSLGHGVGIQVHEGLSVSSRSEEEILPGMVFSIEPGVYVEGLGGVRIEDLVVATQDGLEVLTKDFEKTLAFL